MTAKVSFLFKKIEKYNYWKKSKKCNKKVGKFFSVFTMCCIAPVRRRHCDVRRGIVEGH
jgi:hypothetical protein